MTITEETPVTVTTVCFLCKILNLCFCFVGCPVLTLFFSAAVQIGVVAAISAADYDASFSSANAKVEVKL